VTTATAPATAGAAPITIALPKGRTLGPVATVFARAGVVPADEGRGSLKDALSEKDRALVRRARFGAHAVHFLLVKPDDVPTYVEHGTADLGVCGRDVLVEREADLYHPVDLGIGRCRLVVAGRAAPAGPPGSSGAPGPSDARDPAGGRMLRVATKYPRTAAAHFTRRGAQVEIVNVQGSVELAPLTGLADLIVDLVETGTTLAENGLEVKEEIAPVSSLLVANRASYKLRAEAVRLASAVRAALAPSA
jgi:ATP phosphoribosyltransferase